MRTVTGWIKVTKDSKVDRVLATVRRSRDDAPDDSAVAPVPNTDAQTPEGRGVVSRKQHPPRLQQRHRTTYTPLLDNP